MRVRQDYDLLDGEWKPIVIVTAQEAQEFEGGSVFQEKRGHEETIFYCEKKPYREYGPSEEFPEYNYWFKLNAKETRIDQTEGLEEQKARLEAAELALLGVMQKLNEM